MTISVYWVYGCNREDSSLILPECKFRQTIFFWSCLKKWIRLKIFFGPHQSRTMFCERIPSIVFQRITKPSLRLQYFLFAKETHRHMLSRTLSLRPSRLLTKQLRLHPINEWLKPHFLSPCLCYLNDFQGNREYHSLTPKFSNQKSILEHLWLIPRKGTGFDHFLKREKGEEPNNEKNEANDSSSGGGGDGNRGDNDNNNDKKRNNNKKNDDLIGQILMLAFLLVGANAIGGIMNRSTDETTESASREVTWNDLSYHLISNGQVEKIVIFASNYAVVQLKKGAPGIPRSESDVVGASGIQRSSNIQLSYRMAIGSNESLERKLDEVQRSMGIPPEKHIPIHYVNDDTVMNEIISVSPHFIFLGFMYFMMRALAKSAGGGGGMGRMFQVGKSKAKKFNKEDISVTFQDVAGCQEAKKEIMEFVDFLKEPTRFTKLGAKIPKGALLCGPPGTGKTLLAKAVAGEAGVPFYTVSGSDFIEMFVGVGPARVRDLFKEARANAPCIVFIDEIDAVGRQRGKNGFGGNDERENTLNQLLVEMDGFSPSTNVIILAGTNRIDILDSALTRAGRFDRTIQVDKPDIQGRKEIFLVHLKGIKLDVDAEEIAGRLAGLTPGFAGADIANICNEAAIFAARRSAESVSIKDFESAIDRIIGGMESNKIMSVEERSIVAHHEAGHAVAGWFLEHTDPLLKVTIIPRSSGALGFAQYLPKEVILKTQAQIMDTVCMALAGRAAEEIFFGRVTTGASDDLRRVTSLVYSTIQLYGMNARLGQLAFPKDPNAMFDERPYSDATAMAMDEEAKIIVDDAYERTLNLLKEKKDQVAQIAAMLLEKETITHDDVMNLIGPRPFKGDKQYEEYLSRKSEKPVENEVSEDILVDETGPLNPGFA
jgi:AFG3 family protein